MKNILSLLFLILTLQFAAPAFATDYYSVKSGYATDATAWNTSRNGSGTMPANFNDPSDNFIVQANSEMIGSRFSCKGSLIIETGGIVQTGESGNTTIETLVTINEGGVLKLSSNTMLVTGFILVQGTLQNLGGQLRFSSSPISYR